MENSRDSHTLGPGSHQSFRPQMLTSGQAPRYTASTTAGSSGSSFVASSMDKDLEKNTDVPVGDAAADSSSNQDMVVDDGRGEKSPRDVNIAPPQPAGPMDPSQYPEGGREAWIVVVGAFCGLFVSFGWINCKSSSKVAAVWVKLTRRHHRYWCLPGVLRIASAQAIYFSRSSLDSEFGGFYDVCRRALGGSSIR